MTASVPGQKTHALTNYDIWAWRLEATGSLLSCTWPLCSQVFRSERLLLSALVSCHVYDNFKSYIPAKPIQNYFVLSAEPILLAQGTQKLLTYRYTFVWATFLSDSEFQRESRVEMNMILLQITLTYCTNWKILLKVLWVYIPKLFKNITVPECTCRNRCWK